MNHFLFCIKEYTNIKGSNWLSFKLINTHYNQHNGRPFLRLFVVLFASTFIDVYCVTLTTLLAPLIGVFMASN